MNVPNNSTFCLTDVTAVVGGTSLTTAFACATDAKFCSTYKGSKDRLSNFQGYCGGGVNLSQISTTACGGTTACACICVNPTPAMVAGECYSLTIGGSLSTVQQGASAMACFQIKCNGTSVYCCTIAGNICAPSLGSTFTVCYGNTVAIIIYTTTMSTSCPSTGTANACISATNIKGGFSTGTGCITCYMYTG